MNYITSLQYKFKKSKDFQILKKIIYNYCIIAQKLPKLKQGIKTMNTEFILTRAFIPTLFRPVQTSCNLVQGLLSLTFMSKSKKTLETSLDLMPQFKSSIDTRVEDLALNEDYLKKQRHNFIQKKYGRKRCLLHTHISLSGLSMFFLYGIFTPLMTFKGKKEQALSKQSKQSFYYFFIFWFKVLSCKTQFKIAF